jgi:hypothetical protein
MGSIGSDRKSIELRRISRSLVADTGIENTMAMLSGETPSRSDQALHELFALSEFDPLLRNVLDRHGVDQHLHSSRMRWESKKRRHQMSPIRQTPIGSMPMGNGNGVSNTHFYEIQHWRGMRKSVTTTPVWCVASHPCRAMVRHITLCL